MRRRSSSHETERRALRHGLPRRRHAFAAPAGGGAAARRGAREEVSDPAGRRNHPRGQPRGRHPEALHGWMAAGVKRISVGVQSLADPELSAVGRRHDAAARGAGPLWDGSGPLASGDLILGLPFQTPESFAEASAGRGLGARTLGVPPRGGETEDLRGRPEAPPGALSAGRHPGRPLARDGGDARGSRVWPLRNLQLGAGRPPGARTT